MEEIAYLGENIYRWEVGASTFLASPQHGARLMNWNLSYPDGSFRDIIHWPDLDSIDKFVKARGGNPILFPFSARTFHNGEIKKWETPAGKVLPMPMHGFARQGTFEISRIDRTGFAARLLPDEEANAAYPYDYEFEVIYRFQEKEINVELRLHNQDKVSIPWSAGHHFYFTIPWLDGTTRADYEIKIPSKKAARHADDGSLEPAKKPKKIESIGNPELIDRIHYQLTSSTISCRCKVDDSVLNIEVGTQQTPNPGYALVTWTETAESPFFCIEPWMGPPNSPEHEIGLHEVGPGETQAFSVTIQV